MNPVRRAVVAGLAALLAPMFLAKPASADYVVSVSADKMIKVWNPTDGTMVKSAEGHEGGVLCITRSFDGKMVATGGADKQIKIWNSVDGTLLRTIDNTDGSVTCLAFSPDNKQLLSGDTAKKVKIWDPMTGKLTKTITGQDGALMSVFATDQMIIGAGKDGAFNIWGGDGNLMMNAATNHTGGLTAVTANGATQTMFTAGGNGGVKYWSQGGTGEFDGTQGALIRCIVSSADGAKVFTGGADGTIAVWDAMGHKLIKVYKGLHDGAVTAMCLSPDGKTLFTGGADKKVKSWKTEDMSAIKSIDAHEGAVTGLLYLASGAA